MPHVFRDLWRPKEGIGSLVLELQVVVTHWTWVLGAELSPPQEQPLFSTTEFSLYPLTLLCFGTEASLCSQDWPLSFLGKSSHVVILASDLWLDE